MKEKPMQWAGVLAFLAMFVGNVAWAAPDVPRGRLLYEARCGLCHDRSVHQRESRKATTYEALRGQIRKWDRAIGGTWSEAEVDDVAGYLNERYYHLECHPVLHGSAGQAPLMIGKRRAMALHGTR
ncbi:MAG: hypothetical protein R3E68_16595 [Burkholderiaceae bacterium]